MVDSHPQALACRERDTRRWRAHRPAVVRPGPSRLTAAYCDATLIPADPLLLWLSKPACLGDTLTGCSFRAGGMHVSPALSDAGTSQ